MKSQSFKDYCIKAKQYALRTVISLGKCRDQGGTQILNPAKPQGHGWVWAYGVCRSEAIFLKFETTWYDLQYCFQRRDREKASSHQCINAQWSFIQSSGNCRKLEGTEDQAKQSKPTDAGCFLSESLIIYKCEWLWEDQRKGAVMGQVLAYTWICMKTQIWSFVGLLSH